MKRKQPLENKVYEYMERYRMLQPGDRVAVGVSGGADSVCLLFLLAKYRERIPFEMAVIHVHHGIRADAGEDAAYVRELCERLGVPFWLERADVRGIAGREKISEEEAGRKARYEAFEKYARNWPAPAGKTEREAGYAATGEAADGSGETAGEAGRQVRLALAHHMGDRAETLLFHLFRGTGSRGLAGILPVREHFAAEETPETAGEGSAREEGEKSAVCMTVIRPLLCAQRHEIVDYLEAAGVRYCQDSTNAEDTYARNRIRHHILPCAEKEICEGAVRHVNDTAELLAETEEYLALQTAQARGECTEGMKISVPALLNCHPLIQRRILLEMLSELSPRHKDIGAVHVKELLELCGGKTGRRIDLPQGICAEKIYDTVILERRGKDPEGGKEAPAECALPSKMREGETVEVSFGGYLFRFQILKINKILQIPENQYTKWFDYDKIKGTLSIRTRKTGDYLMIRGAGECVRKKIKDYMITEKVPRPDRDSLPLLADGEHILWIPGYRISEACKVDEETRCILQAELVKNGGQGDGGTCGDHAD